MNTSTSATSSDSETLRPGSPESDVFQRLDKVRLDMMRAQAEIKHIAYGVDYTEAAPSLVVTKPPPVKTTSVRSAPERQPPKAGGPVVEVVGIANEEDACANDEAIAQALASADYDGGSYDRGYDRGSYAERQRQQQQQTDEQLAKLIAGANTRYTHVIHTLYKRYSHVIHTSMVTSADEEVYPAHWADGLWAGIAS
eukprot:8021720-Pyramimonas_sp.AAC.1